MPAMPDREREAQEEVARTDARPTATVLLVAAFLLLLPLVAAVERFAPHPKVWAVHEFRPQWPTAESLGSSYRSGGWRGLNAELRRGIDQANTWFERACSLGRWMRPAAQEFMLDRFHYGNGVVRAGDDDWLFWEKELSALAAPSFLDPDTIARARHQLPETDPATAIVSFGEQLRRRGVALVVVPIPGKSGIETGHLAGAGAARRTPIQNASVPELERRFQQAGLELFDPAALLAERARTLGPQYLKGDSHWRPEAMEAVAAELARRLRDPHDLPPLYRAGPTTSPESRVGGHDLIGLLGFPSRGSGPAYERVEIHQVVLGAGEPLDTEGPEGGVLLLGDSYAEIYSNNFELYGAGAGLPEHLALHLRRPIARLTVDAGGDFNPMEALARKMAGDSHFLDPFKVVVFEFAARELVIGKWHTVALPEAAAATLPEAAAQGVESVASQPASAAKTP